MLVYPNYLTFARCFLQFSGSKHHYYSIFFACRPGPFRRRSLKRSFAIGRGIDESVGLSSRLLMCSRKTSRRTINQFGLRNSLALTLKYCRLAEAQGTLDFRYAGTAQIDDRETLVFERRLPYTNENGLWPDRLLVVHIDKQLRLPTLCQAYADDAKQVLLGSYKTSDIQLNVNLPDEIFTKKGIGL